MTFSVTKYVIENTVVYSLCLQYRGQNKKSAHFWIFKYYQIYKIENNFI